MLFNFLLLGLLDFSLDFELTDITRRLHFILAARLMGIADVSLSVISVIPNLLSICFAILTILLYDLSIWWAYATNSGTLDNDLLSVIYRANIDEPSTFMLSRATGSDPSPSTSLHKNYVISCLLDYSCDGV
jgi:hypothetical protein